MKYSPAVLGIAWICACGNVTPQMADAPVLHDASVDAPPDATCTAELLDGKDNDCDGQIDDGFWATVLVTSHPALAARHPGCSDRAAILSDAYACQLAARRECQAQGYATGFRPAEVDETRVGFTCLADVHLISAVSYADLSRYIPGCGPATAFQTPCFAAMKRYCMAKGFTTGVGPFNVDSDVSIDLACTDHAQYVSVTVDQLFAMVPSCNIPTSKEWDFACFHAYHRYCQSQGFASAWGPVEFDGTSTIYVACLTNR
jgi:hypothetical protein